MDEEFRPLGGTALGILLLVILVYAVLTANIFLGLLVIVVVVFGAVFLHLLYRFVVAVEEIAAKM
ncbi:hypothetical protein [Natronobacterium texcoconense]|uniref:Uncharacterized protein n=1 Tax=Natronobacterium texcoconense TaxID=1095778 RepID=A0A1H1IFF3_NATTX|nr:hypothetical protein [Natronobacterium texcoconense]SDR36411.1 hypothetical protein SAMN04489842_3520 [Natronobacterium texcoconense]